MLSFNNVSVWIAGVHVLRKVTFDLRRGATAALIGRNGAGKDHHRPHHHGVHGHVR